MRAKCTSWNLLMNYVVQYTASVIVVAFSFNHFSDVRRDWHALCFVILQHCCNFNELLELFITSKFHGLHLIKIKENVHARCNTQAGFIKLQRCETLSCLPVTTYMRVIQSTYWATLPCRSIDNLFLVTCRTLQSATQLSLLTLLYLIFFSVAEHERVCFFIRRIIQHAFIISLL